MLETNPCVLFVCTPNVARSRMAEALLRHYAGERFKALSAQHPDTGELPGLCPVP